MTRRTLALALIMLTLALHAGDAVARARGGGSRGSRSFSRPASPPASPTPSIPSRPSSAPAQSPMQPPVSRGLSGSIMGGLAGFALGGLLGSLLFGGALGGGVGLMDLLLIGGALYLLSRVMSARRPRPPAYATAGAYVGAHANDVAEADGGAPVAVPAPPSDLERGLAHIRQMDPAFDPCVLADGARGLFADVQRGITARDMSAASGRLTPRMCTELTGQCDRLRASRQTNRLEHIAIRRAEASEAWQESGQDYVTIYLAGSIVDYTVADASGAVVEGHRASQDFEEYWTFARPVGPNRWKLSAIQTV